GRPFLPRPYPGTTRLTGSTGAAAVATWARADARGVQELREPDLPVGGDGAEVQPRPRARGSVALPRPVLWLRTPPRRRQLEPRQARRRAHPAGAREPRGSRRAARRGGGHRQRGRPRHPRRDRPRSAPAAVLEALPEEVTKQTGRRYSGPSSRTCCTFTSASWRSLIQSP